MKEFNKCELTKFELKYDNTYINLERKNEVIMAPEITSAPVQPSCQEIAQETKLDKVEGCQIVAPMVGTVYRSPEPGADPFVDVGRRVKKGDIVCIIEAMKLMNEVEAEIDGEIIEVLIDNEEMVEFGQPLFIIKA